METQFPKNRYESIRDFVFNYPEGDNISSWVDILGGWISKNRDKLYSRAKSVITATYVMQIVKAFNTILLNDILYNHVIFSFPGNKLFMFIAQANESSKKKKVYFSNGMYSIRVCLYYVSTTRKKAIFKYIYYTGLYKNEVMKALNKGHKYPRQEDVVSYINNTIYG